MPEGRLQRTREAYEPTRRICHDLANYYRPITPERLAMFLAPDPRPILDVPREMDDEPGYGAGV